MELIDTFVGKMWLFDKNDIAQKVEIVRARACNLLLWKNVEPFVKGM